MALPLSCSWEIPLTIWMDFSDFPKFQNFLISKVFGTQKFVLIWNSEFLAFQCIKGALLAKCTCLYTHSLRNRWKVSFLIMFVYFSFLKTNYEDKSMLKYVDAKDATGVCCMVQERWKLWKISSCIFAK